MDLECLEAVDAAEVMDRWQRTLPPGLQLLSAREVAVSSRSLSQQLESSSWRFILRCAEGTSRSAPAWEPAIEALLSQDALIWEDTDKKSRPRRRDVRHLLESLQRLEQPISSSLVNPCSAELELVARVDPQGRSLKPSQVQLWLSEQLGLELSLSRVRRMELTLLQC